MARTDSVRNMANVFLREQPEPATRENARAFEEGLKALSGLMGVNVAEVRSFILSVVSVKRRSNPVDQSKLR
jgi:hypothetical protein